MDEFLAATPVVDWNHPAVRALAHELAAGSEAPADIARRCFEWVRDEIRHSVDYGLNPVTCSASEVLAERTGFCYAKSHLLAALLRANGIPAGFCYQRLWLEGDQFCLHGLSAVWLPETGWYRVDARGNRAPIDARWSPPEEHLAFRAEQAGEADLPEIWPEPLPVVVAALRRHTSVAAVAADLPDLPPIAAPAGAARP